MTLDSDSLMRHRGSTRAAALINAYLVPRHRIAGGRSVPSPVLVRIGEGDFYEDSAIRFAPNIQVSRDGQWAAADGRRQVELRSARWVGVDAERELVDRSGAGIFYMQDTGVVFDMARNAAGRRQDISDPLLLNLNWNAPFFGSGPMRAVCATAIVCVSNHYVLGNDVRPQDAA